MARKVKREEAQASAPWAGGATGDELHLAEPANQVTGVATSQGKASRGAGRLFDRAVLP